MNVGRAMLAGTVAGAAMTVFRWLARRFGFEMNTEMMLGTMLTTPGATAWLIGFGMHLVLSALIALGYAWGFEHLTHRAGIRAGLGLSVIHVLIAGLVTALIPAIHPRIPQLLPAPGAFMVNMGASVVALFAIERMIYGAVVGGGYASATLPARNRGIHAAAR
ncbi:MAG: hypothetical protein ACT4PJ_13740 [Gemmatimonadaceae bacterium]